MRLFRPSFFAVPAVFIIFLGLTGCGGGGGGGGGVAPPPGPPDTTAPLATVLPTQMLIGDGTVVKITFDESMNTASLTVGGNLASASNGGVWSTTTVTNDTLTISPTGGNWPLNTGRTLIVNAEDLAGNPVATINLSYDIYRGTLYYVDGTRPDDTGNGLTPATARKYIHSAVASATAPATVLVNAGVYEQSSALGTQVMLKDDVSMMGGFNAGFTSRDPATNVTTIEDRSTLAADFVTPNRAVEANNVGTPPTNSTVVDGFTIEGSSQAGTQYGAAIVLRAGASPIIRNNRINGKGSGGETSLAVYIFQASPKLLSNTIIGGNGTTSSYGIYSFQTQATIERNTIYGGDGVTDSYGLYTTGTAGPSPYVQNNLILGGSAQRTRGMVEYHASSTIRNNTIHGGTGTLWSRAIRIDGDLAAAAPSIDNNILLTRPGADSTCIYESVGTGSASPSTLRNNNLFYCEVQYFDVDAGCPGNGDADGNDQTCTVGEMNTLPDVGSAGGNIALDPMFVNLNGPDGLINDIADNDWHFSGSSPVAVKAGGLNGRDQAPAWSYVNDRDNVTRPASATPWSIGAYEP